MTTTRFAFAHGNAQNIQNTQDAIRKLAPFKTGGAFFGVRGNFGLRYGHRLNAAETAEFQKNANDILYTVVSYGTPIAYAYRAPEDPDNPVHWHVVDQRFSASTGRQQSFVRGALGGRRRTSKFGTADIADDSNPYQDVPISYEGL